MFISCLVQSTSGSCIVLREGLWIFFEDVSTRSPCCIKAFSPTIFLAMLKICELFWSDVHLCRFASEYAKWKQDYLY